MSDTFKDVMRRAGYYEIDYGFSCGRHWISIDGKVIAQTEGDDIYLKDEDIRKIGQIILGVWDKKN